MAGDKPIKQSYERYFFRLIKQERNESFKSFISRLKSQINKCHFADPEAQLKDQIIEKCNINGLRQKAFESEMSLEHLILTGETIERVNRNSSVAQPHTFPTANGNCNPNFNTVPVKKPSCTRCGRSNHGQSNPNCPAKKTICLLCKKHGHFQKCCRSLLFTPMKRRAPENEPAGKNINKFMRASNDSPSSTSYLRQLNEVSVNNNQDCIMLDDDKKAPVPLVSDTKTKVSSPVIVESPLLSPALSTSSFFSPKS